MKRSKLLSLLLCLTVMFSMCFAFSSSTYAAQETQSKQAMAMNAGIAESGTTIKPDKYEKVAADFDSLKVYSTPEVTNGSQTFTYTVKMPSKGTLFVQFAAEMGNFYLKEYSASSAGSTTNDYGDDIYMFYVPAAGNVTLTFCAYNYSGTAQGLFGVYYAPGSRKFSSANKSFYLGSGGSGTASTFTVKVPSNGYLKITAIDDASSYSSVSMKTKGFKGWDSLNSSNNYYTYVGVKKGTYTFRLKNAKLYKVETKFTKIKETSSKATKKSAAKIKKKALNKGIIPANKTSKKHWYKIVNPKNQKMKLVVNANKMSDGGSYGSLKVTVYFPDGSSRYRLVSVGSSETFEITYGKYGTTKARKGKYLIKIESDNGCNGYYTLKWK